MHPILFHLPWFGRALDVHSYGVMLALGFAVAALIARRHARRLGEDPRVVTGVWLGLVISSLLGARLLFVLTNPTRFVLSCRAALTTGSPSLAVAECTRALRLWEGGDLVFYGGAIGCLAFLAWYTRRHRLSFSRTLDVLIPSVALGHAMGRVGCFLAGCCYGSVSHAPWAVRYDHDSLAFQQLMAQGKMALGPTTPPLHPVQLYEAAGELALFFLLAQLLRRRLYDGQVFVAWLAGYGLLRLGLESLRGDEERRFVIAHLSTSQTLALFAIVIAAGVELWYRRRPAIAV